MAGKLSGAVKRLVRQCTSSVYRVLCVAHQLDLVRQAVFDEHVKKAFYDPLISLVFYFRGQNNLIPKMYRKCPLGGATRCVDKSLFGSHPPNGGRPAVY